jgi:hypothetical protein
MASRPGIRRPGPPGPPGPAVPPEAADQDRPRPVRPRVRARAAYGAARLVAPNPVYRWLGGALESRPGLRSVFTAAERRTKGELFGCRMCGQCALPATGYACPMSCPKELRNGPCGGVGADGSCEVYPDRTCVWVEAYERARSRGHAADLRRLQRPIDHRRWGESSWINYWQGRDEGLWTDDDDLDTRPRLLDGRPHLAPGEGP